MKNIFFFCSLLIISLKTSSQINYSPLGTWKYTSGTDTVEIYLKTAQVNAGTITYNVIIGFHKYVKNGVLIENSLIHSGTNYLDNKYTIYIFDNSPTDIRIDGHFKDITLNYSRYIIFTKINVNTMNVRLTSMQGRRKNGTTNLFTLPRNFQLKQ
jgi:hypothetical protein